MMVHGGCHKGQRKLGVRYGLLGSAEADDAQKFAEKAGNESLVEGGISLQDKSASDKDQGEFLTRDNSDEAEHPTQAKGAAIAHDDARGAADPAAAATRGPGGGPVLRQKSHGRTGCDQGGQDKREVVGVMLDENDSGKPQGRAHHQPTSQAI